MCGIFGVHHLSQSPSSFRSRAVALSRRLRHRGPDWSGCITTEDSILCHERLAIVGVDTGAQPMVNDDNTVYLAVNGEIYNHRALRKALPKNSEFKTHSDCEVIMHLYKEHDTNLFNLLDGMFSFLLLDTKPRSSGAKSRMIAARDPIGITTLYMGRSSSNPGAIYFASELKALHEECDNLISFPPGCYWDSETDKIKRYYNPTWFGTSQDPEKPLALSSDDQQNALADVPIPTKPVDLTLLRQSLEMAVRKRLMSEVPYGVLLSGGLDSSLIAAIAARETEKVAKAQTVRTERSHSRSRPQTNGTDDAALTGLVEEDDNDDESDSTLTSWPRLHSFSIGLPGSPDLIAARHAASHLGTVHHEYTFTVQEGIDALSEVIYHLETYDVTTVRASTPMFLLSRKIKATGVKMVLSGEGSDEIFGGYLYFHKAPDAASFHKECVMRVKNLHTADCLRANKSTMAWGLEARVPFLDKEFLEVAMNVRPEDKQFGTPETRGVDKDGRPLMEKYIVRKAFDVSPDGRPYLPDSILWRQKEQFSDGVGYSWIDGMKEYAETIVSDEQLSKAAERWKLDTPDTKEAYMIREMFESWYPTEAAAQTAVRWVPKAEWGCSSDPSGRSVSIHTQAY